MTIPQPKIRRDWFESFRVQMFAFLFAVVTLAISLTAGILGLSNQAHTAHLTNCLAQYNAASQISSVARAKLNQDQIDATSLVILQVATSTNHGQVTAALEQYRMTQQFIQQEKVAHPVPPPPKEFCK